MSNAGAPATTLPGPRQIIAFAFAYLVAALLGQWLRTAHDDLPIWWPPSGLYLAVLLATPPRHWLRFAVAATAAELAINAWLYQATIYTNVLICLSQTAGILIGAMLVHRWCDMPFAIRAARDVAALVAAALLGPVIAATAGAASIALSGKQAFFEVWPLLWMGDAVGILIVTPLVLAILQSQVDSHNYSPARWAEAIALIAALIGTGHLVFSGHFPLALIIMPPLLWTVLRFGVLGSIVAAAILSVIAVRYTAVWHGWMASPTLDGDALALRVQLFLGVAGVLTVLMAMLLNQREHAQRDLQQLRRREQAELEARVAERTAELRDTNDSLRRLSALQDSLLEAERSRIAREIHDELGAAMTGVTMHLQTALSAGADALPPVQERLKQALQLVDAADDAMHRIINDLRPSVLDYLGIWEGLEWLANEWQKRTGLPAELAIDPALDNFTLEGEPATALFRIVQESLTNVARHARATRVDITARLDGNAALVTIKDNGQGISEEHATGNRSTGMLGMRERARRFDAVLHVSGEAGRGTQVALRFPLGSPGRD